MARSAMTAAVGFWSGSTAAFVLGAHAPRAGKEVRGSRHAPCWDGVPYSAGGWCIRSAVLTPSASARRVIVAARVRGAGGNFDGADWSGVAPQGTVVGAVVG